MAQDPLDEIERMFGLMSEQFGTKAGGVPVDVIDDGDALVVRLDLPGYEPDDVDVTLTDDRTLRVTGERSSDEADGRYVKRERRQRTADRTVSLPESVEGEASNADYAAGVLTVRLPKRTADGADGTDIPVN